MTQETQKKLPKGWEVKKLGDLAHFINGAAFKPSDWHEVGKPIIRIQNLNNPDKPMNLTKRILDKKYLVEAGDLLMSWSASLGVFIWKGPEAWLNQHIFKVLPFPSVNNKFLYHILEQETQSLLQSSHLHGATMQHINRGPLLAHTVLLPPLAEQKRIVARLDKQLAAVEKARHAAEAQVEATDALPAALLREVFASKQAQKWPQAMLGEVCTILDSLRKPVRKNDRVSGNFPYYGATGILDYVDDFIFDETLVLIGEDGAKWSAGEKTAFLAEGKYWVNNHAHVIRPRKDTVLDDWIVYHINNVDISDYITGLTVPKLNQAKLKEILIPLPPLAEQKRIVARLDKQLAAIKKTRASVEAQMASIGALPESLLRRAFSGVL